MKQTYIITGGGSGGHIAPVRALAKKLQQDYKLVWIGSGSFEEKAAGDLDIRFYKIFSGKFRRGMNLKNLFRNIFDLFRVAFAVMQSFFLLIKLHPEKVFSTGGFVSVPVVFAAALLRKPIIIHEQTIGFGLANKIGAIFAKKILLAFPDSQKYIASKHHHKIEVVGNPIREELLFGTKESLENFLGKKLSEEKPLLYVTGGGQGSQLINETLWRLLPKLTENFYLIHQCGKSGIKEGQQYAQETKDYFAFEFIGDELADIYACADVVLARSGAGTVNELACFGTYSIFVPLQPTQNDEQTKNAQWFLKSHKGAIFEQQNFSSELLLRHLEKLSFESLKRNTKQKQSGSSGVDQIITLL